MTHTLDSLVFRYVETVDEIKRLKKERAACICDHEAPWGDPRDEEPIQEADYHLFSRADDVPRKEYRPPCWKWRTDERTRTMDGTEEGMYLVLGFDDWCPSCKRRQLLHEQLRPALKRKAARLSALISAGRTRKNKREITP